MRRRFRAWLMIAGAACLCGCAAKPVTPIAMSQPGDDALDCAAIAQQIATNRTKEEEFVRKDKKVEQQNVAKGVAGVIPGVGLLIESSTDLSNTEQVKARSLADRNERLAYLAKQKGCQL